ncbi:MAG: hypothetical protein ACK44N_01125 [Bacteroidota bacterium]
MSKKSVAFILLVVFIIQLFGMTAMYFSQRYTIKQSALKIIESEIESNFTNLKLSILEFQLAKFEENELFINGQLYDIVSIEFCEGHVIVKAFHDTGEESFIKMTIDWFDTSNSNKSPLPKLILKTFFSPVVLIKKFTFSFLNLLNIQFYKRLSLQVLNVNRIPDTPPPNE